MTTYPFNFKKVHSSWQKCLHQSLLEMDHCYLEDLIKQPDWLPGAEKIFNAFSIPLSKVNYVLIGESPYPRKESANGYAFWDGAVKEIWSPQGLSKKVNRATSLRNIIKMLLVAEGFLKNNHVGQPEIAKVDKQGLVQTNEEFFNNFLAHGFLLLNASLVFQSRPPKSEARSWFPFIKHILQYLFEKRPGAKFILLGQVAHPIRDLICHREAQRLLAEHPYNHSFITNHQIQTFFKPLHLLRKI